MYWLPTPLRVGTITLKVPTAFRKLYECAAWYRDVRCLPQTVDLYVSSMSGGQPYFMSWRFEGTIVDEYFQSLWCGVPVGKAYKAEHIGDPDVYVGQNDNYNITRMLPAEYEIVLDPGVAYIEDCGTYSDGHPMRRLQLYEHEDA